jgi:hypothetical protein
MKSDSGYEQAISAIKILRNYTKVSNNVNTELHNFGAIQSLAKAFFSQDKTVRKISIEILGMLHLTDETALELASLGMVGLSLKLMNQAEYSIQYHGASLFRNIMSRVNVLAQIIQNEDFETLIAAVDKAGSREVRIMYLQSLFSLTQIGDIAPELARHGLL